MQTPVKSLTALPTLVTLGNAFCGLIGIAFLVAAVGAFERAELFDSLAAEAGADADWAGRAALARAEWYGFIVKAVVAMLSGMIFDFLDGKVARLTKSESQFGVQMDSLSDSLTFGALPALMIKVLFQYEFGASSKLASILACFYLAGAILRLARFNVEADLENDDHRAFAGLPSPAAAAGLASLVYLFADRDYPEFDAAFGMVLPWVAFVLGFLMWTKLPYIHFVNVALTERRNFAHLFFVLLGLLAIAYRPPMAIALIMVGYAISGPVIFLNNLLRGRSTVEGESLI